MRMLIVALLFSTSASAWADDSQYKCRAETDCTAGETCEAYFPALYSPWGDLHTKEFLGRCEAREGTTENQQVSSPEEIQPSDAGQIKNSNEIENEEVEHGNQN
jgi:hypothetical protein